MERWDAETNAEEIETSYPNEVERMARGSQNKEMASRRFHE